ncbi:MAG: hypothetical protein ACTSWY_00365 [Promethearchaeota archaeon]
MKKKIYEKEINNNVDFSQRICPECDSILVTKDYQTICSSCGLIVEERLIQSSYKMYDNEQIQFNQGKQYVSIGKTLDTIGNLGSYIDYYDRRCFFSDFNNQGISLKKRVLFTRLKNKYSKFSKIKNKETDYRIMKVLSDVTKFLHLSREIRKDAAFYFRKIKSGNKKIKNNISLIAFCIYFAVRSKNRNAPITITEICQKFQDMGHRVNPRLIIRDGILYKKALNPPKPHKSEDYIERLINDLINSPKLLIRMQKKRSPWTLDEYKIKLRNQSISILNQINVFLRGGRNPFIFAGATIYCADKLLAKKDNRKSILTQKIASNAMGIAEYSIRDHYVSIFKKFFFKNLPINQ